MSNSRYINISHERRSLEAKKKRIQFASAYAFLWRKRAKDGQSTLGVQILAADVAGFGKDGFSDQTRYNTQRSMSTRLLKDPAVTAELQRLGFVFDDKSKRWHDPKIASAR